MCAPPLALHEHLVSLPSHLIPYTFSSPGSGGRILGRQGWRPQAPPNPSQNAISRVRSGASNPPSEQRNDEGQMNSAILLVDVASASRDSWKSFLQSQNYEVFTAEDG